MSGVTAGVAGSQGGEGKKGVMQRALDMIERVGNKVPHPVLMFLYLILLVIILSTILAWAGVCGHRADRRAGRLSGAAQLLSRHHRGTIAGSAAGQ